MPTPRPRSPRDPLLAALLGNDALRGRVKRLFPLPLRTRIGQAIRTRVPTEKPVLVMRVDWLAARAMPKSVSTGLSAESNRMLPGATSRCT